MPLLLFPFWSSPFPQSTLLIALLIPLVCHFCSQFVQSSDVFTAMVDVENLLVSEAATTSNVIKQYIQSEQARLDKLRDIAEDYAHAITDPARATQFNQEQLYGGEIDESIAVNPVNAYLLIKRLTREWKEITSIMNQNMADQFIKNITDGRLANSVKYPDDEDLEGAANGLIRLQDTYHLKTADLANGYVGGESVGKGLSAHDCFDIGRAAYNQKEYYYTLEWMNEALERNPSRELQIEILEYLAYALYQQGNQKRALVVTRQLAQLAPNHSRANGNIKWYEERMSADELEDLDNLPDLQNKRNRQYDIEEREEMERLCRGNFDVPVANTFKLYCYLKRDKPFLKLAPIKVEIMRYEPLAVLFRQIISDPEIEVIKRLATPRLRRATVQNAKTGQLEFATYRISKTAWLKGEEHPVAERINKRINDMTNLDLETAEELQVSNYGIGGHYDPHFDFSRRGEKDPYGTRGNRVATVLIYMSQPSKGGWTVYTDLGMGVPPTKHDALFWYNIMRDGKGDMRTRHAACPVLTGVKWVCNKWIHERGQEWVRPCALKENVEERFVGDLSPL